MCCFEVSRFEAHARETPGTSAFSDTMVPSRLVQVLSTHWRSAQMDMIWHNITLTEDIWILYTHSRVPTYI